MLSVHSGKFEWFLWPYYKQMPVWSIIVYKLVALYLLKLTRFIKASALLAYLNWKPPSQSLEKIYLCFSSCNGRTSRMCLVMSNDDSCFPSRWSSLDAEWHLFFKSLDCVPIPAFVTQINDDAHFLFLLFHFFFLFLFLLLFFPFSQIPFSYKLFHMYIFPKAPTQPVA